MLDDDNSTPTTEPTTVSRTRRRAAGRPAGPPAPVSTDIFAPPAGTPAPAVKTKKAAATRGDEVQDEAPAAKAPRKSTRKAPAKDAAETPAAAEADSAPDAEKASQPAKRSRSRAKAKDSEPDVPTTVPTDQSSDTDGPDADGSDVAQGAENAKPATARKKSGSSRRRAGAPAQDDADATADAGRPSGVAVAFQAPETVVQPPRSEDDADDSDARDDSDAERAKDAGADSDDQGEGGAPKRRRRSRGGRRRNKNEDGPKDGGDDAETSGDDSGDDDAEGGSAGTRRRRRRARAGENASTSPDDPENTVVRVREGRNPEDEITGVSGSTRLEAKKQRRREGREAGRRRAPIVSEAEFLARREAVDRQMVVRQHVVTGGSAADAYTQIAVLEDSVLVEHYVARESQTSLIGNVYLGKVQNVLPSMEAAFVDIGAGRNAVIYAGEVDWSGVENGRARKIEEALSPGQQILVQVTKDPVGQKGARLTSQVSLPGRFLVYVPGGQSNGISRKLPDTERARLKALLKEVLPEDAGVIVRTAAEGATEEQLTRDVAALTARWDDIRAKAGLDDGSAKGKGPQLLYAEPDLVIKVVRDLFNEDFASLVVDGPDAWDNISGYVSHVAPDLAERLSQWQPDEHQGRDSFDVLRIDEQIHKALERKVWLPSGGSLVIDRTEAMTVVDVNTGKFTGSGGNLEETVTKNNLEAAEEIVRQLRLRDIGGIIVVDFIDMVLESNRDLVLRRLVECLGRDRTRHQVAEVTSLGLVQMTRKRIGTGLLESFSTDCEHCDGRGVVITAEPVEPKKDEPRRGRRGRGGNGGGGGNNRRGGQKQDDAKEQSAKDDSAKDEPAKDEARPDDASDAADTPDVTAPQDPTDTATERSAGNDSGRRSGRGRSRGRGSDGGQSADAGQVEPSQDDAPVDSAAAPASTDVAADEQAPTPDADAQNATGAAVEEAVEEQATSVEAAPDAAATQAPDEADPAELPTTLPHDATASSDPEEPTVLTEPDSTP